MESQYFRTFFALPFHVEGSFLLARDELMDALSTERISWTKPEQFHITIRFLGDTSPGLIEEIKKTLHKEMPVPGRIGLELAGLSSFGPKKRPRVIWVGFENGSDLDLLKTKLDAVLQLCGYPAGERIFQPHLTLGRIRSMSRPDRYHQLILKMGPSFRASVTMDKLVFYRSITGPGGPEYQVLDELIFNGT